MSALYVTAGVVPTAGYAVAGTVVVLVTTRIPYKPIGPWIEGCVPDSIRYVPGFSAGPPAPQTPQHKVAGVPTATSVEKDCTRAPCTGGVPTPVSGAPGALPAIGQVSGWALV